MATRTLGWQVPLVESVEIAPYIDDEVALGNLLGQIPKQ
jgi:hypothetical protein